MRLCPNGHEVGGEAKFCPICGAEVIDNGTTYCTKCGNERKGTENFCSQCGTLFGASPISSNNKTTKKKSSKKGIIIAAVACLLVLAAGGAAWYFLQKDKYSLEGLAIAAVNYDWIEDFSDGLAVAHKGDKHGYIDKMGNEVIPCVYESEGWTATFYEGLALVKQGGRTFFIDKKGKEAFSFNYEGANTFHDGLALVWKDGKYGYIDKKGNEVIPLTDRYQGENFSEGLAAVCKDGKYGYIDPKGNIVIPIQYKDESVGFAKPRFNGGFATIKKNGKYGFIDTKGNEVAACKYNLVGDFSEGLAMVSKDGKYGFIDANGNEVIPCKYDFALSFTEGLAPIRKGYDWGFVDTQGNEVIPCDFDNVGIFSEGYALVSKDGKKFLIDKDGKESVVFNVAGEISYFKEGFAIVTEYPDEGDELYGFVDENGKEIAPCVYTLCRDFSEGLAVVQKDGVYGFIDKKGNSTFDIQNEEVRKVVQAKISEIEEKRRREEAEERRKEEERNRSMNESYGSAMPANHADISGILRECESDIRQIQAQVEEVCNTFVSLASGDVDMLTYGRMKITMAQSIDELTKKANRTFDDCIRKLNDVGETNAANNMKEEKKKFYRAAERIKHEAQQRAESIY